MIGKQAQQKIKTTHSMQKSTGHKFVTSRDASKRCTHSKNFQHLLSVWKAHFLQGHKCGVNSGVDECGIQDRMCSSPFRLGVFLLYALARSSRQRKVVRGDISCSRSSLARFLLSEMKSRETETLPCSIWFMTTRLIIQDIFLFTGTNVFFLDFTKLK